MNGQSDHFFVPDGAQPSDQGQDLPPEMVASLIEKFYTRASNTPAEIAKINSLLVQVQTRNSSLELPEKLLQSSSSQVRFFAAVLLEALAKKLSPGLSEDKKNSIKAKYIQYISFAIKSRFGVLEFTKLSRACTELYVAVRDWQDCFRDLARLLFGDDAVEYERLSKLSCAGQKLSSAAPVHVTDPGMSQIFNGDIQNHFQALVANLPNESAVLLINFMGALVENLFPDRIDLPEIEKTKVNESFVDTCQSLLPMLSAFMNKACLLKSKYSPTVVINLMLKHPMFLESSISDEVEQKVEYLMRSVWLQVLRKLTTNPDGEIWGSIEEVVNSVFTSHSTWVGEDTLRDLLAFATAPDVGLIKHATVPPQAQEQYDMQLAARRLCRDIAKRALEAKVIDTNMRENFLQLLDCLSLSFDLVDEGCEWAMQVVEFWTQYAEYLQTYYNIGEDERDLERLKLLLQPMSLAMIFIFPRLAIPEDPDDEFAETLAEIQIDAQSLFAQAYLIFNGQIGKIHGRNPVPGLIMQTEPDSSLYGLATPELAVRMLSGLAEYFTADVAADQVVCPVFGSKLFVPLNDAFDLSAPCKSREVDACIDLLEKYAPMLARNPQFLPNTMEFLFSVLETNMNAHDPEVGRAMKAMCQASRTQLIPHFESLIERYQGLQEEGIYFPEGKVDILASFGIIALAVDKANGNLNAITKAIKIIEEEVETFLSIPDPEETTFTQDGIDALQAILELGRLLRSGSSRETAISLDDDDEPSGAGMTNSPQLQQQAEGLRQLVSNLMSTLASSPLLDKNDEAFRTIWDTLRLAQHRTTMDLHTTIFDFQPPIFFEVLSLCIRCNVATDYGLDTFGQMLVARYKRNPDDVVRQVARSGYPLCIQYMDTCSRIDDGGDSMSGPLKLLLTYIETCSDIVDESAAEFPHIVDLVTPSIQSSNFFTQEAACDVWRTLLRSNESFLTSLSHTQLQALSLCVVQQVSGKALERCLPPLAGVLAAIGTRGGPCKSVLEETFRHLESQGVKVANWSRLVQQIFMLKGDAKGTRRVVEQFWRANRLAENQIENGDDSDEEAEIVLLDD